MHTKKLFSTAAVAGLAAGLLVTAPAQAGSNWGSPQEVSSKFGNHLAVSDGGRVAAWVRTNKTSSSASGPIRTAWYKSKKKGWTPSAAIPGASGATNVQLSSNGNQALIEIPGTGYVMAQRDTKNTWLPAATVVSGTNLGSGLLGAGNTVVYVDWGPDVYPSPPGKLYRVAQNADGTWPAPTQIGTVDPDGQYYYNDTVAFSKDGSTVVWVSDTYALMGVTRNDDGSWAAPTMIRQFASSPSLYELMLSADGTKVMWLTSAGDGILISTRVGTTWAPASTVTVDETYSAALSPDGLTMAWGNTDRQFMVSRWNGVKWLKAKQLGSSSRPMIALSNKTLAWTYTDYKGSSLRSAIYKKGKWQLVRKHSSTGFSPAVSYDSKTLAWSATGNKRTYSVKR